MTIRMNKVRASAHLQNCTLNIANVCNHDPATTVLAHVGFGGSGTAKRRTTKERNAVYACHSCHDAIDGRMPWNEYADRWFYIARALVRTAERRDDLGL